MSKGERKRQSLATRDGGALCHYCRTRFKIYRLTIDHIVPRSRGGSDAKSNLVLACEPCNHAKGSRSYDEFVAVVS